MTSERAGLGGYALLQASVATNAISRVVNDFVILGVEGGSEVALGNGHSHSVGETLAQRTGANFNSGGHKVLWVARGDAPKLAEIFAIIQTNRITREVKHAVLKSTSVPVGQNEAVTVPPLGR